MTNTHSPDEDRELIEEARKLLMPVVMVGDFDDDDDELEPTYPPPSKYNAHKAFDLLVGRLESLLSDREQGVGGISGSREPSPSCTGLGPSGFDPGRVRDLAECLKQTVGLARAYSHGTGSIFENAMTGAERLADRTIAESAITAGTRSAET